MSEVKQKKTRSQQIRASRNRIYDEVRFYLRKDGKNSFTVAELKDIAASVDEST